MKIILNYQTINFYNFIIKIIIVFENELFICHQNIVNIKDNYKFSYEKSDIFSLGINILKLD